MRRRACGLQQALAAVEAGDAGLLLLPDTPDAPLAGRQGALEARARELGVPVWRGSEGDMRRMSPDSAKPEQAIAMLGERADVDSAAALARPGAHWLLHRLSYPSNVGFAIRTAEVGGATSVAVDASFNHAERSRASHVSMGADRLLPVNYVDSAGVMTTARDNGHRIIAVEAAGQTPPWEVDLTGDVLLVVGAERDGIAANLLARCDAVACIPMPGFVPSYSLQAAVSAIAVERLRQLARVTPTD